MLRTSKRARDECRINLRESRGAREGQRKTEEFHIGVLPPLVLSEEWVANCRSLCSLVSLARVGAFYFSYVVQGKPSVNQVNLDYTKPKALIKIHPLTSNTPP